jgi:hypothetical protein
MKTYQKVLLAVVQERQDTSLDPVFARARGIRERLHKLKHSNNGHTIIRRSISCRYTIIMRVYEYRAQSRIGSPDEDHDVCSLEINRQAIRVSSLE